MIALFLVLFVGLMLAAAICDVASMKIPNKISIALALAFPIAALAAGYSPQDAALQCAFGVAALVVTVILFQLNLMGGGDSKLIAAASLWLGLEATPTFIVWTTIAGAGLAAIALVARRTLQPQPAGPAFLNRLLSPKVGIPYGVAIAIGALAALPTARIAGSLILGR